MASTKAESSVAPPQKYGRVVLTLDNVLIPIEKLIPGPSSLDGLDPEIEFDIRVMGCEMIQTSGILLRLPQVAMACGQVIFQRFYYAKSLVRYPMEATAMACVALASKIEEAPRKIRDVINVFRHIRQVRNGKTMSPVILDTNYITLKNQVIKAERRLLKELGFCCHVKHPHKMIIMYLRLLEADHNRNLAQSSWNYMNDALRTDAFMRHPPETIACACIWLAARQLRMPLPENPPWYHIVSVDLEHIQTIAASILRLYTRPKIKMETLEVKIEEIRKEQQEARLRNKLLPPHQQTPIQPQTSNFSPGSRTDSPRTAGAAAAVVSAAAVAAAATVAAKSIQQTQQKHVKDSTTGGRHHRSGSDTSPTSSGSGRHHKKQRRSKSRSRSRSLHSRDRSRSNERRSRGRSRSRDRSRDRSRSKDRHARKSVSRSSSPNITPPPRFIKNKEKGGPIVQSVSRSRSRSPLRTYDKYERQDKYNRQDKHEKYDRRDKHSNADKSTDKMFKYSAEKYDKYEKTERHSEKYEKNEKYDRNEKYVEKMDKYERYDNKIGKSDKHKGEYYVKEDKYGRDERNVVSKYDMENKDKIEKYDKVEKHEKLDKAFKYENKLDKKRSHESKKVYDNGYEKYEKVHKSKKNNRHRSRSRDRRR